MIGTADCTLHVDPWTARPVTAALWIVRPIGNAMIHKYIVPPTVSCSVLVLVPVAIPLLQSMRTLLSSSNVQESGPVVILWSIHHPIPVWISRVIIGLVLKLQSLSDRIPLSKWYAPMTRGLANHPIFQLEPIALSM